jgi:methionine biosynthesis protein MetW
VVSFPNFGHYKTRIQLMFTGCAPVTKELPYEWYDTPNIRVLSLRDFENFTRQAGFRILKKAAINTKNHQMEGKIVTFLPNLFATYGIFLIGHQ